jgi:hypothetical protein
MNTVPDIGTWREREIDGTSNRQPQRRSRLLGHRRILLFLLRPRRSAALICPVGAAFLSLPPSTPPQRRSHLLGQRRVLLFLI